ncbi:hypothetical protein SETIT_2G208000v2 [Setaria italica]|uniref:Uncharacterized protein n=1 Tax=Setaria italica TaxID=4555 RepID=K3ZW05_SETIT|nr:uncharacterized protein LOC101758443 isoform X2 [Setaria italica]RCV11707.1 hypothetical protein SETIT_2G208000v2 [Setaria italica]
MDDIGGGRGRKGDALLTPPRGPGLPSSSPSPSGSGLLLPCPPSAAAVLALPASRDPAASEGAGFLAAPRLAGAMDGGGEALLVRRSKGKKRPPAAAHAERDSGAGGRFRSLMRDYNDLLEETEAKKKMLASANRTKLALAAEVKFLQRKHRSFAKSSNKTHYKLKKQARYVPSPLGRASVFADHDVTRTEGASCSKNPNFDLNQGSAMNDEGNDYQGHRSHLELDNFDQVGVDEEMIAADVKLSVCRDSGNSPASDDKRTIPWQDRLALKA